MHNELNRLNDLFYIKCIVENIRHSLNILTFSKTDFELLKFKSLFWKSFITPDMNGVNVSSLFHKY